MAVPAPAPWVYIYDGMAVVSGNLVEVYEYEKAITLGGQHRPRPGRGCKAVSEVAKEENRAKSLARAKQAVRRIVEANVYRYKDRDGEVIRPKFVTLTFRENVTDLERANVEWGLFLKRLNYALGKEYGMGRRERKLARLRYLVVVEFQKRGAVHYHVLFFNLPYMPVERLGQVWGHGFVKINAIEEAEAPGAYVTKYMDKARADQRLEEEKSYFTSRGLYRPEEIKDREALLSLWEKLIDLKPTWENTYRTEYQGSVFYRQYRLSGSN